MEHQESHGKQGSVRDDETLTNLEETPGRQDGAGELCRRQEHATCWGNAEAAGLT